MSRVLTSADRRRDRDRWWSLHDRDEYVCPDCGRTPDEHDAEWEVHHIDGVPGQIVGLCRPCHRIRHGASPERVDLEFWKHSVEVL